MPAPELYQDGTIDPFIESEESLSEIPGILYATDRHPAGPDDDEPFYLNDRGGVVRLGVANIGVDGDLDWEDVRDVSMMRERSKKLKLRVTRVDELGVLDRTVTDFTRDLASDLDPKGPSSLFARLVNQKLARSKHNDVYIYVNGYKVPFESGVLIASELWHFLGYQGVFMAYPWPTSPATFAHAGDIETAAGYARNLRELLRFPE